MDFLSLPASLKAAAATLLVLVLLKLLVKWREGSRRRYPPLVGTLIHHLLHHDRLYDYHTRLARSHKTFRILPFGTRNEILTVDPINIEYILKTNFNNYGKGWFHYNILKDLLGDGIFAVDGEKWRQQRKLASYDFSTKILKDFSTIIFRSNVAKLAQIVSDVVSTNQTIDFQMIEDTWNYNPKKIHVIKFKGHAKKISWNYMKFFGAVVPCIFYYPHFTDSKSDTQATGNDKKNTDLFTRSTIDSIFQVGFGSDLDTLYKRSEEAIRFTRAFDDSNAVILSRYTDIFWTIKHALNIGSEAKLKKNIQLIDNFVFKLIHKRMEQVSSSQQSAEQNQRCDMLSRFLESRKEDLAKNSDRYLRDIILNIIIAGKDTTAATLSWFFYMLCKYPTIQEKIAAEVMEATGQKPSMLISEFAENVTEEALNKMHYLHAALTETLRLYPAVPIDAKLCHSDDILPDGFHIKKGDAIFFSPYAMGRMEFLWGEDAEEFKPERWLDCDGTFRHESPFKFTAFQAGPRICLGKEFAYRQMKIFAAVLLHYFVFKLSDEKQEVKYKTMLTLHMDGGLHLRAFNRYSHNK